MDPTILFSAATMASGAICIAVAVYLAPYRLHYTAHQLMLVMACVGVWCLSYGMEHLHPALSMKLFWVRIEYCSNVWIGMLLFKFILAVTGRSRCITRRTDILLGSVPLLVLVLAVTNPFHGLMWQRAWLETVAGIRMVLYERGPAFWIFVFYSYGLIVWGTGLLILSFRRSRGLYRKQMAIIMGGIAAPWVCNILYVFFFDALKNLDFTPFAFTVTGIAFAWGIMRFQLLHLIPMAHEAVMESMSAPVIVLDTEDRVVKVNTACSDVFGISGFIPGKYIAPDLFPGLYPIISRHRDAAPVKTEAILEGRDGMRHWHLSISALMSPDHAKKGWLILLQDITEVKNAEAGLKESEEQQRTMLEASPLPIAYYSENGDAAYVNPAFTRVFGWKKEELTGEKHGFVPQGFRRSTQKAMARLFKGKKKQIDLLSKRCCRSGRILDVSINAAIYQGREKIYTRVVVTYTDISHIKQVESELRQARDYVRSIINSMPSVIIGVNDGAVVSQWNFAAETLTGVRAWQARDRFLEEVFPQMAGVIPDIETAIGSRQTQKKEKTALVLGDKHYIVDIFIYPILSGTAPGAVIRVDDITERIKIDEMMVHSEKMMSVGGLAAGMAHEINNPLAGIIQNIQVIKNRLSKKLPANTREAQDLGLDLDRVTEYMTRRHIFHLMDLAVSAGQRAARIVENMLSFSRRNDRRRSSHFLPDMMEATLDLVKNDYNLKKQHDILSVKIESTQEENLPLIPCERSKIQQVFFNVIKNGVEAMSGAGVGEPRFDIRYFTESGHVCVRIKDNGPGIPEAIRKRIFEPFFTTKAVGVGTGLGLSVSYFIITENHGGDFSVASGPGEGASFIIKLPVS